MRRPSHGEAPVNPPKRKNRPGAAPFPVLDWPAGAGQSDEQADTCANDDPWSFKVQDEQMGGASDDRGRLPSGAGGTGFFVARKPFPASAGTGPGVAGLVKPIRLPQGFKVPQTLDFEDVTATAINRGHLEEDVAGINASLERIRLTRGGDWPTGPVTLEDNFIDLVWHEREQRDGRSFSYVLHARGSYIGCCYFYPLGSRTPLSEALLVRDVDLSWWVTDAAWKDGYYEAIYRAMIFWAANRFGFTSWHISNRLVPNE